MYPTSRRTYKMLAKRCRAGLLISPFPRTYDTPSHWNSLSEHNKLFSLLRTLSQLHPNWIYSHQTAAMSLGYLEPNLTDFIPHIYTTEAYSSYRPPCAKWHYGSASPVTLDQSIRVTSPEQTVFDCLRTMPFTQGLAIADAYLRATHHSSDDLLDAFSQYAGYKGAKAARACASHADGKSENAGESIARAHMIELGFLAPRLQVTLPDPVNLGKHFRLDYFWLPDAMASRISPDGHLAIPPTKNCLQGAIAGELDGQAKYISPEYLGSKNTIDALTDERRRESRLTWYGIQFVRFNFHEACSPHYFNKLLTISGVPKRSSRA